MGEGICKQSAEWGSFTRGTGQNLGEVECALSFLDGNRESLLENIQAAVVGQLEIVHAGHDTWEVVVRGIGRLARAAHDRKDRSKTLETCSQKIISFSFILNGLK